MHGWREDIAAAARGESKPENLLSIMFAHTETSQAKGTEFLGRFLQRTEDRDATPSLASHLMAGMIPDAEIRIYPDAAHGSIFQYPTEAAQDVSAFLDARRPKTPR